MSYLDSTASYWLGGALSAAPIAGVVNKARVIGWTSQLVISWVAL